MDVGVVASQAARFLGPFLPYLLRAVRETGESAAREAAERFGSELWNRAQAMWRRLTGRRGEHDEVESAAELAALGGNPEALTRALEERLAADPAVADDIAALLAGAGVEAHGDRSVAGITGGTVVTGDRNVVQSGGKYNVNIGDVDRVHLGDDEP